jgi:hypothetical protein
MIITLNNNILSFIVLLFAPPLLFPPALGEKDGDRDELPYIVLLETCSGRSRGKLVLRLNSGLC